MDKILKLLLLFAVLAIAYGCTTFKGGSSSSYPVDNYRNGGSHSGHSH